MGKKSIDRRISRTRSMLQHALNSLILKKDYEAITIQNICDAANVGRSTFYVHYRSKDDLKRSGFEKLRRTLLDRQREVLATAGGDGDGRFSFSLSMFEHGRDHKEQYRALVGGRGGSVSLGSIRRILSDLVRRELVATVDENCTDDIPRELTVQYVVGAYMAVLTWWLDGGAKLSPVQIDEMFRRITTEGVKSS